MIVSVNCALRRLGTIMPTMFVRREARLPAIKFGAVARRIDGHLDASQRLGGDQTWDRAAPLRRSSLTLSLPRQHPPSVPRPAGLDLIRTPIVPSSGLTDRKWIFLQHPEWSLSEHLSFAWSQSDLLHGRPFRFMFALT